MRSAPSCMFVSTSSVGYTGSFLFFESERLRLPFFFPKESRFYSALASFTNCFGPVTRRDFFALFG